MRLLADDDEVDATTTNKSQSSQQPAWMRQLLERCREWLGLLPGVSETKFNVIQNSLHIFQKFNTLAKQTGDNQDPLYRLFAREGTIGRKLLVTVRRDLEDVVKVCQGELKQTNHLRTLMSALTKGIIFRLTNSSP